MTRIASVLMLYCANSLKSIKDIKPLLPLLSKAAQEAYNGWDQSEEGIDEMLGSGGICQDIAENMAEVLNAHGIDAGTVSQTVGDQHVYTLAKVSEGVVEVDISPYIYETGSDYVWKKRPSVKFIPNHIYVGIIDPDPNRFEKMIEDY